MDRLREWSNQISAQLSVLTVSQRLAIGLCAALVAGSLLWLLQWSTTPELVPLITQEFTFDELEAAEQSLGSNGIHYEVLGAARIYVRPADRHNALRLVHGADALPDGSLYDMATVVMDSDPFQSPQARAYAQTYAKGNELAKIIATSPAVRKASVILNPVTKRRLGGITDVPTASVTVGLGSSREMTPEMVEGFAKLVAGAVAGLKPHNVYITDSRTLRSYGVPHPDDATSFDVLSMVKRREEHYRAKILGKLADIPGVQVAVSVELDASKRVTQNVKHTVSQPKMETTSSTENSTAVRPSEPGVQANLGQALSVGGEGQGQSTEQTMVENFEPQVSRTETIEQFPFATKKITAAVGIPRSFIVGVFRLQHPDSADDPKDDDAQFVAVRDAQVSRVKASVERIVMADPGDVEVDVYPDMEWTSDGQVWSRAPGAVALAHQGGDAMDTLGLVRTYAPQAGLATLALVSLAMMMRIVRKSSDTLATRRRRRPDAGPSSQEDATSLAVGPLPVGQAEVSESMLTGKELDPDTLRYQELGQEVAKMVDSDPAGSAELIRRWLEKS